MFTLPRKYFRSPYFLMHFNDRESASEVVIFHSSKMRKRELNSEFCLRDKTKSNHFTANKRSFSNNELFCELIFIFNYHKQ